MGSDTDTEPDEILAALGLPPAVSTVRLGGYEAAVWRAELTDGRTVAVRYRPAGMSTERELAALRLAAELTQPVPDVLAAGTWRRRAAVVTSWCAGRPIGELLADGAEPVELGLIFGRAQARLHEPTASPELANLGPSSVLEGVPVEPDAPRVLAHLDFQPFNVLTDGATVTGIVDWPNAALADRRADLARTRVILAVAHTLMPFSAERIAAFTTGWQAGYAELRPLPSDAELAPFLVAAGAVLGAEWGPRVVRGEATLAVLDAIDELVADWTRWIG